MSEVTTRISLALEETFGFTGHLRVMEAHDSDDGIVETTRRGIFESLKRLTTQRNRKKSRTGAGDTPSSRRNTVTTLLDDLHEVLAEDDLDQFEPVLLHEPQEVYEFADNGDDDDGGDENGAPGGMSTIPSQPTNDISPVLYDSNLKQGQQDPDLARRPVDESCLGARVYVQGYGMGVLRFYGRHQDPAKGIRAGVEMDLPVGRNNGTVGGYAYFICEPKHGVLVAARKVSLLPSH